MTKIKNASASVRYRHPSESAAPAYPGFAEAGTPWQAEGPLVHTLMEENGMVIVGNVAQAFGLSSAQIASSLGLPAESVHKRARMLAPKTQRRIREMLEILGRIAGWAGGPDQAMAWYRSQPIAAFGDQTAEALVRAGKADAVREYLDGIALGGFA